MITEILGAPLTPSIAAQRSIKPFFRRALIGRMDRADRHSMVPYLTHWRHGARRIAANLTAVRMHARAIQ
jgi:hypothetical protein